MLNVITHDWGGLVYAGGVAGRCETAPVGGSGGRDELRRDGEWLAAQGQQDRLEGPDPAPSRRFDHRAHLGMEPGAPDRAEAVGDPAEDRPPAQRLLRAIVGWGSLGLEEEDEQLVLPPEQAAAELLGGHVACDWLRDHLRECEEVAPEEGLDHPGAVAACQALAMMPDANSATQQRNHLPGQHGVAAVARVLRAGTVGPLRGASWGSRRRCPRQVWCFSPQPACDPSRSEIQTRGRRPPRKRSTTSLSRPGSTTKQQLSAFWNTHSHQLALPTRKRVSSEPITVPASSRRRIGVTCAVKAGAAAFSIAASAPSLSLTPNCTSRTAASRS